MAENLFSPTELVGHLSALLVMLSFTMKDIMKLRMINSVGCFFFVVYGFLLATSWPIVITNAFIIGLNCWHLLGMKKQRSLPHAQS